MNLYDKLELIDGLEFGFLEGDFFYYFYYVVEEYYCQIEYFGIIVVKEMFWKGWKIGYLMLYLKIVVNFIKIYFIKLGFFDGKIGWLVCKCSLYGIYVKYWKLMEMNVEVGR